MKRIENMDRAELVRALDRRETERRVNQAYGIQDAMGDAEIKLIRRRLDEQNVNGGDDAK